MYTYTIFDADPNSSSGTEWPTHIQVELEADSDAEAIDEVSDIMSVEAAGLNPADGYVAGERIHAIIWDADGTIVGQPTYELTHEDLGTDPEPRPMYLIEIMPEYHRESHRAARNWGVYPHNGAERYLVSSEEFLPDDNGEYNHVVREATKTDLENYAEL